MQQDTGVDLGMDVRSVRTPFSLLVGHTLTVCDAVTMCLLALIKATAVAAASTYCTSV